MKYMTILININTDFSEGLLTKKGYEFKTSLLVLEKELEEGMELVKIILLTKLFSVFIF